MQLRDYQTAAVAETQRLIAEVPGANPAIVISTGGGKTVCMGHLTAQYQPTHYQAAIAHRRELVSQIALAYAKYKIPHRIIGPSTTVQECRRAQLEDLGYTCVDQSARVGVCSVDTLAARDMTGDAWARSVAIVHMDEFHHCFPAGTLVDGRDIASLKVGDVVTAFDEKTGELHQRTVTRTFKNVAPKYMVRVTTAHHSVECTLSHPFWTQRGWVKAGELNDADYVYTVPNGIHAGEIQHPLSVGEGRHSLLREQQMWVGVEDGNTETQAACQGSSGAMLGMRDGVRGVRLDSDPLEEGRAGVLQRSVLVGVSPPHLLRDDGAHESQVRLGANDESQPDDEGRVPSENDRVHAGQGAESPGRERTTSNEGRGNADANVRAVGLCGAIDLQNGPQRPNALQDRLRPSVPENRNRSGRVLPQHQSAESAGRPQGCAPDRCRVESVQVYESADSGGAFDGHVYNIEVSDLHTYTANGLVVHNCLRDNKWGKALESFPSLKNVIGYTATPRRADRKGLGRHAQGIASHLVEGPAMHELMAAGYLTPYKLVTGAVSDIDLTTVSVAASGDYNPQKLRGAMKKSRQIVGDAVAIYKRYCPQSKAVLFACDVEDAGRYREAFTAAGIPAEIVTAETREDVRRDVMKRFKTGALQVLVNVDLFGEGFDLPAIETVIMCRPTKSLPLYCLDPETEVLTPEGWMGWEKALRSSHVVGFDKQTGETRSVPVVGTVKRPLTPGETIYGVSGAHLDIRVSDKHDMIVRGRSSTAKNWQVQTAEVVASRAAMFTVPVAGFGQFPGSGLTESELHFLGWFLSDGNLSRHNRAIRIAQAEHKTSHIASIRRAIEGCGFKYGEYIAKRKNVPETHADLVYFTISEGMPRGRDKHLTGWGRLGGWVDKSIPARYDDLTRDELLTLLSTWYLGDGSNNHGSLDFVPGTMNITTGDDKRMADRLQALCVQRGLRCNVSCLKAAGRADQYFVRIRDTQSASLPGTRVKDAAISGKKPYTRSRFEAKPDRPDFVWCLTNELGTLITRRNGKVAIVGNCQQFGRALRLMIDKALVKQWHLFTPEERRAHIAASAKPHAWIIDLVRNWAEPSCGGLPDARGRVWSLDGAERSGKGPSDVPPVRACTNPEPISADGMLCTGVYERFLTACPQCGYAPVPAGRTIEQVDGDVTLVDEETLARLRGEYLEAHTTPVYGGPHSAALYARHRERHEALSAVRQAMEWWGPFYEAEQGRKLTDREQMKAFYLTFGVTTLEAVSLKRADADALRKKVLDWMELKGFTIPA